MLIEVNVKQILLLKPMTLNIYAESWPCRQRQPTCYVNREDVPEEIQSEKEI